MATRLSGAALSEIQFRLNTEYVPAFAPEVALLFPRLETWTGYGCDEEWIGLTCDHPNREIVIRYRLGPRHHWLLCVNDREWVWRRIRLLIRLLLRRLSREVAKGAT